jgi:hypothetical protein
MDPLSRGRSTGALANLGAPKFRASVAAMTRAISRTCSRRNSQTKHSARDRQQDPLARPGVDAIVGFGDAVQGQGIAAGYREYFLA